MRSTLVQAICSLIVLAGNAVPQNFWQPLPVVVVGSIRAFGFDGGNGDLLAAGDSGYVYHSSDYDASWRRSQVDPSGIVVYTLTTDFTGHLFAGTSHGIFRSPDHGESWSPIAGIVSGVDIRAMSRLFPYYYFLAGSNDGRLFSSTDVGETWSLLAQAEGAARAFLYLTSSNWFAAVDYANDRGGLLLSTDQGASWQQKSAEWLDPSVIAIAKDGHGRLYAATTQGHLYTSANQGIDWQLRSSIPDGVFTRAMIVNGNEHVFVATNAGVFVSPDGGTSWQLQNAGIGSHETITLYNGAYETIWLSTYDGVYKHEYTGIRQLSSVRPDTVMQGQRLTVYVDGLNTSFVSDSSSLRCRLQATNSQVAAVGIYATGNTSLSLDFSIPTAAALGKWDVIVESNTDGQLILAGAVTIIAAAADDGFAFTKLTAADATAFDRFGSAVAVSNDVMVVGAYEDDPTGGDSGAIYVFRHNGTDWVQEAKIVPAGLRRGDHFGFDVGVSNNVIIAGAPLVDDLAQDAGAIYFFEYEPASEQWQQTAKLTAGDGDGGDFFGFSVAISGDYAIAGAYLDSHVHKKAGSAYVLERLPVAGWQQAVKLTASDAAKAAWFGYAVDIDGNNAVVGAVQDGANREGAAYVFRRHDALASWQEETKLVPTDNPGIHEFGHAVAVNGDYVIIGAPNTNHLDGSSPGAAYIFERTNSVWLQNAELVSNRLDLFTGFGQAVALHGKWALVGADWDDAGPIEAGAAYLYERDFGQWHRTKRLHADDPKRRHYYGRAVALFEKHVVIGASRDDEAAAEAGAVYAYTVPPASDNIHTLPDSTAYGNMHDGDASHVNRVVYRFVASAGDSLLCYSAFDIDQANEVEINLNGVKIGEVRETADLQWSESQSIRLPDSLLNLRNINELVFAHTRNPPKTWQWGVRDVYVSSDPPLPVAAARGRIKNGNQSNIADVAYSFLGRKRSYDLLYQVYDIDSEEEVELWLNGNRIRNERETADLQWSGTRTVRLQAKDVCPGEVNLVKFLNRPNTDKNKKYYWGVRQVQLVSCIPLPYRNGVGRIKNGDTTHVDQACFSFEGTPGDALLSFEIFDIDNNKEVDIVLNNVKVLDIASGPNNGWSAPRSVVLPDAIVNDSGENVVVFDAISNPPRHFWWGVRNIRISTVGIDSTNSITKRNSMPVEYALSQNYPNPFNPSTTIRFALPQPGKVALTVFNLAGQIVRTLAEQDYDAGFHSVMFDASDLASGIYFYRLQAGDGFVQTRKVVLTR